MQKNSMNEDEIYLNILNHNSGFKNPARWLNYSKKHDFKIVRSEKRDNCPDCGTSKVTKLGQYIYYSNLICLITCESCGLIYSDVLINEEVSAQHFETAYKNVQYFHEQRKKIYFQIADILKRLAPNNVRILDVGGAQGHLGSIIKEVCPNVTITINDLSIKACEYAKRTFGFNTICGSLANLSATSDKYDFVLLIDVLYYERDIKKAWQIIQRYGESGVIIRVPNKLWLIRSASIVKSLFKSRGKKEMTDVVDYFNPEHIYIFKRNYIKDRLASAGFSRITIMPSRSLLKSKQHELIENLFFILAKLIHFITFRQVIITPSLLVCAQKK